MATFLSVVFFVHVGAGALYSKYRVRQLLQYIRLCRGRELTEAEFLVLLRAYTSFGAAARFSPSRALYRCSTPTGTLRPSPGNPNS